MVSHREAFCTVQNLGGPALSPEASLLPTKPSLGRLNLTASHDTSLKAVHLATPKHRGASRYVWTAARNAERAEKKEASEDGEHFMHSHDQHPGAGLLKQ